MIGDLSWRFTISDKEGRQLRRTHWRRARSFVVAYLHHVHGMMTNVDEPLVQDLLNVTRTLLVAGTDVYGQVRVGSITEGIAIGSGATPVDIEDFDLDTQIVDGAGAGQLNWQVMTMAPHEQGAGFSQVRMYRGFSNANPAAVTVREVGLKGRTADPLGPPQRRFLLVRDLVSPVQVVNNGETLLVEAAYRITV